MATNPLETRKYSAAQAKEAGLFYDPFNNNKYFSGPNAVSAPSEPQGEDFWINASIGTTQFYKDAAQDRELAKQYGPIAARGQALIDEYKRKLKDEPAREIASAKASSKRAIRAVGGLLSGSKAPGLGENGGAGGGLPPLGMGTGGGLGDEAMLGKRRVL